MTPRILAVAAFLAVVLPAAAASGDAEIGKKKAEAMKCATCHGETGISVSPEFPNLAGQHADYLEAALRHYKNGKRKNPIMQQQVTSLDLKPKDMMDLAAYFASQKGLQLKH
jgi:cytochrome c553